MSRVKRVARCQTRKVEGCWLPESSSNLDATPSGFGQWRYLSVVRLWLSYPPFLPRLPSSNPLAVLACARAATLRLAALLLPLVLDWFKRRW